MFVNSELSICYVSVIGATPRTDEIGPHMKLSVEFQILIKLSITDLNIRTLPSNNFFFSYNRNGRISFFAI